MVQRFRGGGECEVPVTDPHAPTQSSTNNDRESGGTGPQFMTGVDSPVPLGTEPGKTPGQNRLESDRAPGQKQDIPIMRKVLRETDVTLQCCTSPLERELSGEYVQGIKGVYAKCRGWIPSQMGWVGIYNVQYMSHTGSVCVQLIISDRYVL